MTILHNRLSNKTYRFTLPVYDFINSEKRYSNMAEKGFFLTKRGSFLERYEKREARKLQYRIEFCKVKMGESTEMSTDQLNLYADCGWELVCSKQGIYVFCSLEENAQAEIYTDKDEQLAMLKQVEKYLGGFGICFAGAIFGQFIAQETTGNRHLFSMAGLYGGDFLFLTICAALLYAFWKVLYGQYRCHLLIKRAKKGLSLRRDDAPRFLIGKIITRILQGILAICTVGALCTGITYASKPLPSAGSSTPYLLAADLYEGVRSDSSPLRNKDDNTVRSFHGLLSDCYQTREYFESKDNDYLFIKQECYILRENIPRNSKNAVALADSLLKNSTFSGWGTTEIVKVNGFDYVLQCPYTIVAVKGNRVLQLTCTSDSLKDDRDYILEKLSAKWTAAD